MTSPWHGATPAKTAPTPADQGEPAGSMQVLAAHAATSLTTLGALEVEDDDAELYYPRVPVEYGGRRLAVLPWDCAAAEEPRLALRVGSASSSSCWGAATWPLRVRRRTPLVSAPWGTVG